MNSGPCACAYHRIAAGESVRLSEADGSNVAHFTATVRALNLDIAKVSLCRDWHAVADLWQRLITVTALLGQEATRQARASEERMAAIVNASQAANTGSRGRGKREGTLLKLTPSRTAVSVTKRGTKQRRGY